MTRQQDKEKTIQEVNTILNAHKFKLTIKSNIEIEDIAELPPQGSNEPIEAVTVEEVNTEPVA